MVYLDEIVQDTEKMMMTKTTSKAQYITSLLFVQLLFPQKNFFIHIRRVYEYFWKHVWWKIRKKKYFPFFYRKKRWNDEIILKSKKMLKKNIMLCYGLILLYLVQHTQKTWQRKNKWEKNLAKKLNHQNKRITRTATYRFFFNIW